MINKYIFRDIYNAGNKNAYELLKSANILCNKGCFPQAYFLAYTALEEISKSQFSADVFTGLRKEEEFKKFYMNHKNKITNVEWVHEDATSSPYRYKWTGPDRDDFEEMHPDKPLFNKRQSSLYVDVDFNNNTVIKPWDIILEKDAKDIIHIVEVALKRIWEVTGEFGGNQIGTKGFMK
jgi:AbiV family abortive infection protein